MSNYEKIILWADDMRIGIHRHKRGFKSEEKPLHGSLVTFTAPDDGSDGILLGVREKAPNPDDSRVICHTGPLYVHNPPTTTSSSAASVTLRWKPISTTATRLETASSKLLPVCRAKKSCTWERITKQVPGTFRHRTKHAPSNPLIRG